MALVPLTGLNIPVALRGKLPASALMSKEQRRKYLSNMPVLPEEVVKYEPHYYQTEGVKDIKRLVIDGKSVIRTEATGAGKTVEAILYCLEMGYKRILFLSPTETLSRQTAERFTEAGILARAQTSKDRWWEPDRKWPDGVQAIMCSEGTAITRWMSAEPEVIIVDEAHHCYTEEEPPAQSKALEAAVKLASKLPGSQPIEEAPRKKDRFVEQWNEEWAEQSRKNLESKFQSKRRKAMGAVRARYGYTQLASIALVAKARGIHLVGFTATPWRLKDEEGFSEIWDVLSEGPQLRQLSDEGYLVPIKVHRMGGRIRKTAGTRSAQGSEDFTPSQLTKMFEANKLRLTNEAIDWLELTEQDLGRKLRTIIFCCNQKHARAVADYARSKGRKPGLIISDSALLEDYLEVADTIKRFGNGELDMLVNVTIATEGIDIPSADCVMILRDTVSRALLNQMAGRVTRLDKGKQYGLVMDATGCVSRLDSPMVKRKWSLKCRGYKTEGESPTADCVYRDCFVRVHPAVNECWNCKRPQYGICPRCQVRARALMPGKVCHKCKETDRQLAQGRKLNVVERDEFEGQVIRDTSSRLAGAQALIEATAQVVEDTPEPEVKLTREQEKLKSFLSTARELGLDYQKRNFRRSGNERNYLHSHFRVANELVHFEIFKSTKTDYYSGRVNFPENPKGYVSPNGMRSKSNTELLRMMIEAAKEELYHLVDQHVKVRLTAPEKVEWN